MVDTLKRSAYVVLLIAIQCTAIGRAEVRPAFPAFPSMESVFILTSAKSHSISPENPTGEKGQGGKADLNTGSAGHAAKDLGVGWKVNPNVNAAPGSTFTLAQFKGEGIVNHIWMTLGGKAQYRSAILRMYWDDEKGASVETPVGSAERRIGEYRWHIVDPIRFDHDLKVTIQALGWKADGSGTYLPLQDSYASVADWYQAEPHAEFPKLSSNAELQVRSGAGE